MKKTLWLILALFSFTPALCQSGCPVGFDRGNNLILNASFEEGFTGFNSDYKKTASKEWYAGSIYVTAKPEEVHNNYRLCLDTLYKKPGKMLVVDGSQDRTKVIWQQVLAVEPNTNYYFGLFFATLMSANPGQLEITFNNQALTKPFDYHYQHCRGSNYFSFWYSGISTKADIRIRAFSTELMGNDFVMDNLQFYSCKKTKVIAETKKEVPVRESVLVRLIVSAKEKAIPFSVINYWQDSSRQANLLADSNGVASLILKNQDLPITVRAKGHFLLKDTLKASKTYSDSILIKQLTLQAIDSGTIFVLNKLTFDRSSPSLTDEAKTELMVIKELLEDNPEITIQIQGHTDNQGDAVKNYDLSVERVNNVRNFLIEKGIAVSRLIGIGFGGTKPLVGFGTDEERKPNRRVEFVIIK